MDAFKGMNKSIIWITLINYGYVDYTKNFLLSMEKANISLKLVVYCTDKKSMDELAPFKSCVCMDATPFLKYKLPEDLKEWANSDYKKITFAKLDAIYYTLKTTRNMGVQSVGFIDTDIILLKDPTPILLDRMQRNRRINIFSQCDENRETCTNHLACPCICSGVIVFRNVRENYPLFLYTDADITAHMGDQDNLLDNIRKHSVTYMTLEKNILLNGSFPGIKTTDPLILPESACLIHFNWMVGHKKKENMVRLGMWHVK